MSGKLWCLVTIQIHCWPKKVVLCVWRRAPKQWPIYWWFLLVNLASFPILSLGVYPPTPQKRRKDYLLSFRATSSWLSHSSFPSDLPLRFALKLYPSDSTNSFPACSSLSILYHFSLFPPPNPVLSIYSSLGADPRYKLRRPVLFQLNYHGFLSKTLANCYLGKVSRCFYLHPVYRMTHRSHIHKLMVLTMLIKKNITDEFWRLSTTAGAISISPYLQGWILSIFPLSLITFPSSLQPASCIVQESPVQPFSSFLIPPRTKLIGSNQLYGTFLFYFPHPTQKVP